MLEWKTKEEIMSEIKAERREQKRRNRRKMVVRGRSIFNLLKLKGRRLLKNKQTLNER
jgi:hypothetical protein